MSALDKAFVRIVAEYDQTMALVKNDPPKIEDLSREGRRLLVEMEEAIKTGQSTDVFTMTALVQVLASMLLERGHLDALQRLVESAIVEVVCKGVVQPEAIREIAMKYTFDDPSSRRTS